jgi:hypothetical protein
MLLPTMLRQPAIKAMLRTMVMPVVLLQNRFDASRKANLYDVAHTGQVCHIKAVLNDYFGLNYSNGFEIEDVATPGEWLMTYNEASELEYLIPIVNNEPNECEWLWDEKVILVNTSAFFVFVPADIFNNSAQMSIVKTLVNKYRLVSRLPEYQIKPI